MRLVPEVDARMVLTRSLLLMSSQLSEIDNKHVPLSCFHQDYKLFFVETVFFFFSSFFISSSVPPPQMVFNSLLDVTSNKKMVKIQGGWETCLPGLITHLRVPYNPMSQTPVGN